MPTSTFILTRARDFLRFSQYRLGLMVFALFFNGLGVAQEGNYRYESFGNQSLLLNGNVTGSAEDLGLTYYNPARLAFIEEPSIVISGKAYQLINYNLEDLLDSDINLSESSFNGIPSIFSGTFKIKSLPNHQFAYSFISRYRSDINLDYNSNVREDLPIGDLADVDRSFTEIDFRNRVRDEWYGVSWAHKLKEDFSIGATLFGSIYQLNGRGTGVISAEREDGSVANYFYRSRFNQKTYGLFLKFGAAWELNKVSLGINITSPFIAIKKRASTTNEEFLSGLGPGQDYFRFLKLDDLDSRRRTAANVALGAGIAMGKSKLHLSADWSPSLAEYNRLELPEIPDEIRLEQATFNEAFRSVMNFGAGADIFISPSLRLIASFSSDFSATIASPNLFDVVNQSEEQINLFGDFWHFGLGPDLKFKWGTITMGATYSRSSVRVDDAPDIPDDQLTPRSVTSAIGFERWRFIFGFEIPLISDKLKNSPIK